MNPIHRYDLCGENRCNWAVVLLTSDGIFSAVSDYGEFGYVWRAHGCKDFREFFLQIDVHYFMRKLAGGRREWNEAAVREKLKRFIIDLRKRNELGRRPARELWDDIGDMSNETDLVLYADRHAEWWSEIGECCSYRVPIMAERFAKEILPKLAEAIRVEMDAERPKDVQEECVGTFQKGTPQGQCQGNGWYRCKECVCFEGESVEGTLVEADTWW